MLWKIRIQIQTTRMLLQWGNKNEKLQKLQSESFFFCLFVCFFKIHIHYFLTASFKVPPEKKSAQPEVPITTQILI